MMIVTKEEFPQFLEIFVEDIANELGISVNNAIQIAADYYEMEEKEVRDMLKSIDSYLTSNNNVIYFDEMNPVKRTTFLARFMKIIDKIGRRVYNNTISDDAGKNVNDLMSILECNYGKYCYLNRN